MAKAGVAEEDFGIERSIVKIGEFGKRVTIFGFGKWNEG